MKIVDRTPNGLIDPVPESFTTLDEAPDFWDTHGVSDYWDEMQEVKFEVRIPIPHQENKSWDC